MISNLDFPNFEDDLVEDDGEKFDREIRDFQKEMEMQKAEWKEKMEKIAEKKIMWNEARINQSNVGVMHDKGITNEELAPRCFCL